MRNLKQMRDEAIRALSQRSPSPVLDVDLLLCAVLDCSMVDLILRPDRIIAAEEAYAFQELVARRIAQEPVAYLLGHKAFMGLDFKVTEAVLIPRPDTEILVEAVLEWLPKHGAVSVLDIGTGSGAILISLLHERKGMRGVGLDISEAALAVAQDNAEVLGVADRCEWVCSDLYTALGGRTFDVILSNPPYINEVDMAALDETVRCHEPHSALYGGQDGLMFYRQIIAKASSYLKPGGIIGLEIGYDQKQAVSEFLEAASFVDIKHYRDLAGHDRVIVAQLNPNRG